LLPQLRFALEFDDIHVSRDDDVDGGGAKWKVVPRRSVAGRTIVLLDDIPDEGETLAEVVIAVFAD
jgi:hypoxanthine phosphoribosyltransferase